MAMKILDKYPITLENIVRYSTGSKAIYKCHIMHALMDYGYTTDLYGDIYDELFDAKTGLCSDEVKCEVTEAPEVHFVLELIHSSGGVAVLAHPRVYDNFDLLEELAASGKIDGVEVWNQSAREQISNGWLSIAEKYNLITPAARISTGSTTIIQFSLGYNSTPQDSLDRISQYHKKEAKEKLSV